MFKYKKIIKDIFLKHLELKTDSFGEYLIYHSNNMYEDYTYYLNFNLFFSLPWSSRSSRYEFEDGKVFFNSIIEENSNRQIIYLNKKYYESNLDIHYIMNSYSLPPNKKGLFIKVNNKEFNAKTLLGLKRIMKKLNFKEISL